VSDILSKAYRQRRAAEQTRDEATERFELADAYLGLDSLLKGAWGMESLNALGGGKFQIEKAHKVLGAALNEATHHVETDHDEQPWSAEAVKAGTDTMEAVERARDHDDGEAGEDAAQCLSEYDKERLRTIADLSAYGSIGEANADYLRGLAR